MFAYKGSIVSLSSAPRSAILHKIHGTSHKHPQLEDNYCIKSSKWPLGAQRKGKLGGKGQGSGSGDSVLEARASDHKLLIPQLIHCSLSKLLVALDREKCEGEKHQKHHSNHLP